MNDRNAEIAALLLWLAFPAILGLAILLAGITMAMGWL